MKKKLLLLCSFIYLYSNAQQNFINVPSSEATEKNKLFFQQQLNFNELIQSNTTIDYGLGKGFEVGANVLGLNFNHKQKSFLNNDTNDVDPYNPLVLINGLKQFKLTEKFSISGGSQYGLNFRKNKDTFQASLFYFNLLMEDVLIKKSKWVGGVYYNSRHYGGKGTRLNIWIAAEIPIIEKIHFMAESILGDNALSYTSIGVIYYPKPYLPLTFGFEIPNVKRNSYALVFELTYIPTSH